jgi:hypothetical protein
MITENETFAYCHNILNENIQINTNNQLYIYFNFGYEAFYTTDFSLLSSSITSAMSGAIAKESLQSSGTLTGLMVGMSLQSPSIIEVMICISVLNIELGYSIAKTILNKTYSYIIPTKNEDAQVPGNIYRDEEYCFRKIDPTKTWRNRAVTVGPFLYKSSAAFLLSFYLFNEMKKIMPAKNVDNPLYYKQFLIASNIALTVLKNSERYGVSFIKSFAATICPLLL